MEAGAENSGNMTLKRQRAPLSDSEDNVLSPPEVNDGQKRRRLEVGGQENHSPKLSESGRRAELGTKPDTPMIPSVRSRVQQLNQRREGAPPRCLSDPSSDSPSAIIQVKGLRNHLLSEGEFSQRMERFKVPVCHSGPTSSPTNLCPRTRSNLVSGIHQKLQGTTTPSSKEASRLREEREQELNQLPLQPISENAWLKRSCSDPTLTERWTPPGPSSPSSSVPRSRRRVRWPPIQPWDQVDSDPEMKECSFTEAPASGAEKPPVNTTGERALCVSEAPAASVKLESSSNMYLQMECTMQNAHRGEEITKEEDYKALVGTEEQLVPQELQAQAVLKLSCGEDQSFSKPSFSERHNVSGGEQRRLESAHPEPDNKETDEVSEVTEQSEAELLSFDGDEKTDDSSYVEAEIELSTDEELWLWRYPQGKEEGSEMKSSRKEKEDGGRAADNSHPSDIQESECYAGSVSAEVAGSFEVEEEKLAEDSVKDQDALNRDHVASFQQLKERGSGDSHMIRQDRKDTDRCSPVDDLYEREENMLLESNRVTQMEADAAQTVEETQTVYTEDAAQLKGGAHAEPVDTDANDPALSLVEFQVPECPLEAEQIEQGAVDERRGVTDGRARESHKAEKGESTKKVTFILEPELINDSCLSETSTSAESRAETSVSDVDLNSHDDTNTNEMIDRMFEEVLEYAGRAEEDGGDDEDAEDRDSGIGVCSGDKDKMDTESEKEKSEEEGEPKEECDESKKLDSAGDELLTFPPCGILSPLSKSVEAVVTPLRLAASQGSNPPSLLLTPEEITTPPAESAPLYSVDAYRTQRQSKPPTIQSVTPGVQRRAAAKSQPQQSVNTKERIMALTEEARKLQTVINQTLQALSCCTDEEHGRGSLEEAEAEKLLLVSCEKRSALLAEVATLRDEKSSEAGEAAGEDGEYLSQQPCRGTVSITNIQLPLKVEFVCSSHGRAGRPSHYFFILIRYGPCNIIATPLATAADAQNGDTISFSTSVTLKDIRSSFEIDVEVYSLSHTSGSNCNMDRTTTKSRVTPRKLLNTLTRSSNSLASAAPPALATRRSSNFCLVGSHKITLSSLGHTKFPLDKMKLEGKIRRLLGDEFQEKVPFLSPLEGNIYLKLESESHSNVQHQGFLTMFEMISGYGVWHRRYFVLEGCSMNYWNHPNDKETKEAEGSIALSSSPNQCVRPVKRDSCARPFTFELVSNVPHQQQDDSQEALAKCWFSADTKQERLDWMEKLNQTLLDFHTWSRAPAQADGPSSAPSGGNLRESIL